MDKEQDREKQEAFIAGKRALASLIAAQDSLNSARNWGIWDILGGGVISSLIKHSKMDNAKENMERAKYDLENFSKELQDVYRSCDLSIETKDFLSFADWFLDGFFVDWMVQDRINTARNQVDEAIQKVRDIISLLE